MAQYYWDPESMQAIPFKSWRENMMNLDQKFIYDDKATPDDPWGFWRRHGGWEEKSPEEVPPEFRACLLLLL